jgi:nitrate reductase beta subunit
MRSVRLGQTGDPSVLDAVGLSAPAAEEMYRLLALSYHSERCVLPTVSRIDEISPTIEQGSCGFPR